jgi:diacylglycerol O-acyltransferase / wax synthase
MPSTRLSALDASFLTVESPTAHMHVGWAAIFDPPQVGRPSFDDLRDHIASRLPRAPRYRQTLREVPLGLNAPIWVDDPRFEVNRHVLPLGTIPFGEAVDQAMSEPLPKDRPLWQLRIAERLEDGRIGVIGKSHHCMVDGIAAVELATLLIDPTPNPPPPEPDEWAPRPLPGDGELLTNALVDMLRGQLHLASLPARLTGAPGRAIEVGDRARRAAAALLDAFRPARLTQLNGPISPRRRLGRLARPIADLAEIKRSFGVKLNDVLLAVCCGGMRGFLRGQGTRPIGLKTMVPVNVRAEDETGDLGNRISFMFVDLPCEEPDPVRRLREIHAATTARKRAGQPEGGDDVLRSIGLAPSPVQRLVSKLVASPRAFNLTVSNIPGPRERFYMRGCPLVEAYPVVPIADRHALSIGITTVGDAAFFGLYADPESLPEVEALAAEIDGSIDELLDRARSAAPTPEPALVASG